jgi:CRISPR/Cas system CMR subunit Cmr6 (Cas7 group RAMP superfamily)
MPVRKADTPPIPLPVPEATHHHLESLAAEVHRTYFYKYPPLPVRWGQQISRKKRRSIRLGSYNHATTEVRIHPILNSPLIPAVFVQSVIHHEYLHHVLGPHHNRRFHQHERQFRYHREAQEWIRRNLFILLGRPRQKRVVAASAPQAVQALLF